MSDPIRLREFQGVERTGFDGIAPLPKKVSSTIANAKRLPRIVEY